MTAAQLFVGLALVAAYLLLNWLILRGGTGEGRHRAIEPPVFADVLTIAQQVMEIDRLQLQVEQRDQTIEGLRALANADYDDLRLDLEAASATIARKDAEIASVRADYDAINERNSCLYIEVAELAQEVAELKAALGRSEDRRYEP